MSSSYCGAAINLTKVTPDISQIRTISFVRLSRRNKKGENIVKITKQHFVMLNHTVIMSEVTVRAIVAIFSPCML